MKLQASEQADRSALQTNTKRAELTQRLCVCLSINDRISETQSETAVRSDKKCQSFIVKLNFKDATVFLR